MPFRKNMRSIFFIIFFSITIFSQTKTGTVKGRVVDIDDGSNSMAGANIFLLNTKLGAATDINGYYEIRDVPLGKYTIQCSFIGYATQKDTIELTENDFEIIKDFDLKVLRIPISMPDSIKEYHNLFSNYKSEEVLKILIDSLSQDYRTVYLTFTNETKLPVYLIEDLPCFNTVSIIVKNENGKSIRRNLLGGCDVIPITLPKKENLIKLETLSSIHFPPFVMQAYSLKDYPLPKGKYYISIKYEIKNYKYLPGVYSSTEFDYYNSYKEEIEVLNQATRGVYYSENEIVIEK
jgi:hypothetical protein